MENKKISRREPLRSALLDLEVGDKLEVPYRYFSEPSIRVTASQLKHEKGVAYELNFRSERAALVTRIQ